MGHLMKLYKVIADDDRREQAARDRMSEDQSPCKDEAFNDWEQNWPPVNFMSLVGTEAPPIEGDASGVLSEGNYVYGEAAVGQGREWAESVEFEGVVQ
ncbi:hypothetical protein Dsin_018111 [Dipteronia sinensis]|uniref:Uncharacterized protein n=1 Tax=Dipteronia sinensis TaxID=43782 RepID=A0AAE0AGE3_9ROSI|nr:hypothetical protein Dsin_018111 [Dipteronia sinensis]